MSKNLAYIILIVGILLSFAMHLPHLSKDIVGHHSWRQTQTQSTTINFYEEDMNILNPRRNDRGELDGIYRMELPLFQWINASIFFITGKSILTTRLFLFFIGVCSIVGMFFFIKTVTESNEIAVFGAFAFIFSPSFYYFMINPIPDNMALCLGILALGFQFRWIRDKKIMDLFFGSLLMGLSASVKLPFVLFYAVPFSYGIWALYLKEYRFFLMQFFISVAFFLLPLSWYLWVIPSWNADGIIQGVTNNEFDIYQTVDLILHNVLSTFPELLINYAALPFFLIGIYAVFKKRKNSFSFWSLAILFFALMIFMLYEINMIAKVHDYYLFPFYPIIFLVVGIGAYYVYDYPKSLGRKLVVVVIMITPITCYIRTMNRWDASKPGFNVNYLLYKDQLRNIGNNNDLIIIGKDESHYISLYYVNKKGWVCNSDKIDGDQLEEMIRKGAKYLFTDSYQLKVEDRDKVFKHVGSYGNIDVYKLK